MLIPGVFFAPSISFCQVSDSSKLKMNRVSIETGPFHYFFDNAPILNVNYQYNKHSLSNPFKGLFLGSIGIKYKRRINIESALSFEMISFRNNYKKHIEHFPDGDFFNPPKPLVFQRLFTTITINYIRIARISQNLDLNFGAGLNFRNGYERILVNKNGFSNHSEGSVKNDLGLNAFGGIDYTPIPWFTFYSKIDFMGLVYLNDKENIERLGNYSKMPDYYPSRFDLSLRFGIGVNF